MKTKPNEENVYSKILNMYVGNDEYLLWKNKPFFIDNNAIAINDHEILFFDKKLIDKIDSCAYDQPQLIKNYIQYESNQNLNIDINLIKKKLELVPLVECYDIIGKDIECKECDGEGEVEWEYGKWNRMFNCPVCNGSGFEHEAKEIPNGKFRKEYGFYIDVLDCRYSSSMIEKLIEVSEILKEEITLIFQMENEKWSIFKIGEVKILCMPVLKNNNENVILKIVKS